MTTPKSDSNRNQSLRGNTGRLLRLIRKELSEILRDRRTILTLVLMPMLLYPLLSIAFRQFLLAGDLALQKDPGVLLGCSSDEEALAFAKRLSINGDQCKILIRGEGYLEYLAKGQIDLAFRRKYPKENWIDGKPAPFWELFYLKNSYRSLKALREVEKKIATINNAFLEEAVKSTPLDRRNILRAHSKAIDPIESEQDFPLAALVPLILILMTITGAVYPAIDLTAGERERGTLEVLVAAPVPRLGLLFAKYVSVWTVAVLTALINLVMMTLTVWYSGLGEELFGQQGISLQLVLQIFGLLLLFAGFFSALLLSITSFARSFKEAQAYIIPLMLFSLGPGLAGMIPGINLTPSLSLVPLLNIVLLGRDLFEGTASGLFAIIVISSTITYSIAAIALAARVFGAEDVLYNEQNNWGELFRRPNKTRPLANLVTAFICLGAIFSITFVVQGTLSGMVDPEDPDPTGLVTYLVVMGMLGIVLFAGLPLFFSYYGRVIFQTGLSLRKPAGLALFGSCLLGISLWALVLEFLIWAHLSGFADSNVAQLAKMAAPIRAASQLLPLWFFIAIHAGQGIGEELFFRGYLFNALRKYCNPLFTILISGFLFGLSHLLISPTLGVPRLLTTTLLGVILGWVCWKSKSVIPSMILHALHNGILIFILYWLGRSGAAASSGTLQDHLPILWIILGGIGTIAGFIVLVSIKENHQADSSSGLHQPGA